MDERAFSTLTNYLKKIPGIDSQMGTGADDKGFWWVKFKIDIDNKLAWHVVQELGCVVNYISVSERLPTKFYPVSPAPYLNGGPDDFLSWVIENTDPAFKPGTLQKWLEERLPNPVDDPGKWITDDGDEEE